MPQLDFSTWPSQIIWLIITFGFLYAIIVKFALPKIGGTIELRRDRIASDLDEAQRLKAESEKALADYETALGEAKARAHAIAQETRDKLAAEMDAERAKLDAELDERLKKAEAQITKTKQDAMANVSLIAEETAGAIVNQLIGVSPKAADLKKAISKTN